MIDAIAFAPEAAAKIIQGANYQGLTNGEGLDSTVETTPEDPEEESKMHEEASRLMGQNRMTMQ